ncbi:uncharacterized protein LOC132502759 [Mesoplodon densirostris]|uniref:uncharacterized protein LOC132502759 n=1 Tax=Mesoplodon densirostris TaxID=48708 RepID=UPI0028DC4F4E|nr:uncharacterized protein LOC132502759 [Mesoplodon densirostris]
MCHSFPCYGEAWKPGSRAFQPNSRVQRRGELLRVQGRSNSTLPTAWPGAASVVRGEMKPAPALTCRPLAPDPALCSTAVAAHSAWSSTSRPRLKRSSSGYAAGLSQACMTGTPRCHRAVAQPCYHECCRALASGSCLQLDENLHFNGAAPGATRSRLPWTLAGTLLLCLRSAVRERQAGRSHRPCKSPGPPPALIPPAYLRWEIEAPKEEDLAQVPVASESGEGAREQQTVVTAQEVGGDGRGVGAGAEQGNQGGAGQEGLGKLRAGTPVLMLSEPDTIGLRLTQRGLLGWGRAKE